MNYFHGINYWLSWANRNYGLKLWLKLWTTFLKMFGHDLTKAPALNLMRGFYIYLFLLLWRENQLNELSSFQMIQNLLFVNLTMFWMKIVNSAAGASLAYDELVTWKYRSSHTGVFLENGVLKICSKFTGEHPCRRATLLKSHFDMGVLL